jgi:murein DD-endopeptidase MepM/ murein hydrolase activator NlpD
LCYGPLLVSDGRSTAAAILLLVAGLVPAFAGIAGGQEKPSDLKARMRDIQADLDATTARIEDLRTREDELAVAIERAEDRAARLRKKKAALQERVIEAAVTLYKTGEAGTLEALFSSESLADLALDAERIAHVSERDRGVFIQFARTRRELIAISNDLADKKAELAHTRAALADEAAGLRDRLAATREDYRKLMARLARERKRAAAAAAAAAQASAPAPAAAPVAVKSSGNMACPVAGPVSFTDTWGAPRSGGRSHQGVDMMANYGTPVVAIVSGTITYSGYGSSAGNWQILSGDDGHAYWYMHNQANTVTGGHVKVGQQIATVGDTGNATGVPHLHFEYHPGGGGAVNPTPLVASIC